MGNQDSEKKETEDTESDDLPAKCRKERDEYLDGWKRAKAELINYKKDEIKRFGEVLKFGQEGLVGELVRVLDSFDLALAAPESKNDEQAERGLFLIRQQLEDILKKNGLEKINVAIGDRFDPNLHEAIAQEESGMPSGTITEEMSKGYLLNNKVLRPSRVKISK